MAPSTRKNTEVTPTPEAGDYSPATPTATPGNAPASRDSLASTKTARVLFEGPAGDPGVTIHGTILASAKALQKSIDRVAQFSDALQASEYINKLGKSCLIAKLTTTNWQAWIETIKRTILLTSSAAAFEQFQLQDNHDDDDDASCLLTFHSWWVSKLRDVIPSSAHVGDLTTPYEIMAHVIPLYTADAERRRLTATGSFWQHIPRTNSLRDYLLAHDERISALRATTNVTASVLEQVQGCFVYNITKLNATLGNSISLLPYDQALVEARKWLSASANGVSAKAKGNTSHSNKSSTERCSHCNIKGHTEANCRKKKRTSTSTSTSTKVLAVGNKDGAVQLDCAADNHVVGSEEALSDYVAAPSVIQLAGTQTVTSPGHGTLPLVGIDSIESLPHAIVIPGQQTLLSVGQLEQANYSIDWTKSGPVRLRRPDGAVCAVFHREGCRYIWRPERHNDADKRDWHAILGHPGPQPLKRALKAAGITGYQIPNRCVVCDDAKITTRKGHGSLRTATRFGEVLHVDLVGGKNAFAPKGATGVPQWYLLLVDEFTAFKWAFPVSNKKEVTKLVLDFLDNLAARPVPIRVERVHCDSGGEFLNGGMRSGLSSRGVALSHAAGKAHEQNGILERNVRTVNDKMRAIKLQSGFDMRQWPHLLHSTIDTLNWTPNKVSKTPAAQAANQYSPDLAKLHPFGCRATWIEEKDGKLDSRATVGVYVGHVRGGHKLYNPATKRVIIRRDARFRDDIYPLLVNTSVLAVSASPRRAVTEALNGPKASQWRAALQTEMDNMATNDVWELVPRSSVTGRVLTGRWVMKEKSPTEFKARWVARGYGEISDDTYASVLPATTLRVLLAHAASKRFHIRHVDVVAAFLHSPIDEDIWVEQPHGMEQPGNLVCKLKRAIYGLRSAPRRWQQTLRKILSEAGFKPLKFDENVYRRDDVTISTYVDDFMIVCSNPRDADDVVERLGKALRIKDLGDMSLFIGIEIKQGTDGIRISHHAKIQAICEDLGLGVCRGAKSPIADDGLLTRNPEDLCDTDSAALYRSTVGSFLHIAIMTRPDLQYAVNRLAQLSRAPTTSAFQALKHLARYASSTASASVLFPWDLEPVMTASSDSSWGSAWSPRGTTGNVFLIGGAPVAWLSKKQSMTAQSTCEAEYEALRQLVKSAYWLPPLFHEIFGSELRVVVTQVDNTAAMITANSDKVSTRNRHFLMRMATVREAVKSGTIKLRYTPSAEVVADGFTKALPPIKHADFCKMLNISST